MHELGFVHGAGAGEHQMYWVDPNGTAIKVPNGVFFTLDEIKQQKNPYPPTKSGPATKVSANDMRIYEIYR